MPARKKRSRSAYVSSSRSENVVLIRRQGASWMKLELSLRDLLKRSVRHKCALRAVPRVVEAAVYYSRAGELTLIRGRPRGVWEEVNASIIESFTASLSQVTPEGQRRSGEGNG